MVPRLVIPDSIEVSGRNRGSGRSSAQKESRFRGDWLLSATVTSKTGMRSLSTACDSEQEPQPRKLSCRISIRLEEIGTRHCLLNASEGMIFRDSRFCKEELGQKRFHPA